MNTIAPESLETRLAEVNPPIVIDVLPDEQFEKCHIPNTLNACVYEIEFLEKAAALTTDKNNETIVYGKNDQFEAASRACEKLANDGWTQITALEDGLDSWIDAGYPTTRSGETDSTQTGIFKIDPERSIVRWIGRNLLNQHNRTIPLKNATIALDKDRLISGSATLDMNRITCEEIKDAPISQMLIDHLRTDDFFLVDTYPTADLDLISVTPIENAPYGSPNYNVSGTFTLRGKIQPLHFFATFGVNDEVIAFQAQFDFDRVLWGSKYGSGKIYEALGKHVVNDRISISFQLIAPLQ